MASRLFLYKLVIFPPDHPSQRPVCCRMNRCYCRYYSACTTCFFVLLQWLYKLAHIFLKLEKVFLPVLLFAFVMLSSRTKGPLPRSVVISLLAILCEIWHCCTTFLAESTNLFLGCTFALTIAPCVQRLLPFLPQYGAFLGYARPWAWCSACGSIQQSLFSQTLWEDNCCRLRLICPRQYNTNLSILLEWLSKLACRVPTLSTAYPFSWHPRELPCGQPNMGETLPQEISTSCTETKGLVLAK